jgi:hypothetical protein
MDRCLGSEPPGDGPCPGRSFPTVGRRAERGTDENIRRVDPVLTSSVCGRFGPTDRATRGVVCRGGPSPIYADRPLGRRRPGPRICKNRGPLVPPLGRRMARSGGPSTPSVAPADPISPTRTPTAGGRPFAGVVRLRVGPPGSGERHGRYVFHGHRRLTNRVLVPAPPGLIVGDAATCRARLQDLTAAETGTWVLVEGRLTSADQACPQWVGVFLRED